MLVMAIIAALLASLSGSGLLQLTDNKTALLR
jgi:hypothetical protein